MTENIKGDAITDAAYDKAKKGIHSIMKTRVELARDGALIKSVDKFLVAAAAELGALILAYNTGDGIAFMLEISDTYFPLLQVATEAATAELLALETELYANSPQDR